MFITIRRQQSEETMRMHGYAKGDNGIIVLNDRFVFFPASALQAPDLVEFPEVAELNAILRGAMVADAKHLDLTRINGTWLEIKDLTVSLTGILNQSMHQLSALIFKLGR